MSFFLLRCRGVVLYVTCAEHVSQWMTVIQRRFNVIDRVASCRLCYLVVVVRATFFALHLLVCPSLFENKSSPSLSADS